jgi:stage II sporulation protein M
MENSNEKKEGFNLLEEYKKCWDYIKESRTFIYSAIGIFLLFVLIGIFIPAPEPFYSQIINFLKQLLDETQNLSQPALIWFIISNNLKSTFLGLSLGIIFGIYPVITALSNGYLLGFVSLMSFNSDGGLSLWKILPHGIFELPAVFISLGIGIRLGMFIFQKNKLESLKYYSINSLRIFLLIVVPLLIIAGIIEGTLIFLLK